ncbi:hypothetical protein P378_15545 [Desulforamulus profundi]|uniref:Uncharacterized protein n=1 Tax=Desulforamulus profundi TaxID=1383067 RepID=A0A2C6MC95_9FIRM|nr:hypothetical protein [Desulforamulus profundi]PHJ37658.1 hypothetical protein P378_15545 [Desulforamulus profundi]
MVKDGYKYKFTIVEYYFDTPEKMKVYECICNILEQFGIDAWLNFRNQMIIRETVKIDERHG